MISNALLTQDGLEPGKNECRNSELKQKGTQTTREEAIVPAIEVEVVFVCVVEPTAKGTTKAGEV